MRSVRVVKGPASVAYGPQTVGGAIDLLTKEIPSTRLGTIDLGYGLYGYNKASFSYGAGNEQFGFLVEGVHLGSLGFKSIDTLQNADTGFGRNEVMVKRPYIKSEWIELALAAPVKKEVQSSDGRIRHWVWVEELSRYLRVVTLGDGTTVHNAFPDRRFTP